VICGLGGNEQITGGSGDGTAYGDLTGSLGRDHLDRQGDGGARHADAAVDVPADC